MNIAPALISRPAPPALHVPRPGPVVPVKPTLPVERDASRDRSPAQPVREGEVIGSPRRFQFETLRESRLFVTPVSPADGTDIRTATPPRLPTPIASYLLHSAPVIHSGENIGRLFDDFV